MQNAQLSQRDKLVLASIVRLYLDTAGPVGSGAVSKDLEGLMSSASVRNIMAMLMDMGFLSQPHTSAGRVPTVMALRYFVDNLMEVKQFDDLKKRELKNLFCSIEGNDFSLPGVLKRTTKFLSDVSHYAGIATAPKGDDIMIRRIEFIPLDSKRILGLVITPQGEVMKQLLGAFDDFTYPEIEKISNYCNGAFIGLSLSEARSKIASQMMSLEVASDKLIMQGLKYLGHLFSSVSESDVIVGGEKNLLACPEFKDTDRLASMLSMLAKKRMILDLLDQYDAEKDVRVHIGSALENDADQVSVVASDYLGCGGEAGCIGLVGPVRMDYQRVIPLVSFAAELVGNIINFGMDCFGGEQCR